jgi:fumarate hydratase class II
MDDVPKEAMTTDSSQPVHPDNQLLRGVLVNPSTYIREIAALSVVPEVKERLEALAAAFETQHNQQNNAWGVTLGRMELSFSAAVDAIRFDLTQELGHSEARQKTMLEMLEQMQADIRELAAREVGGDGG